MTKEGKTKTTSKGKLDIIILPIKESQAMTKDRDTTKTPKKKTPSIILTTKTQGMP